MWGTAAVVFGVVALLFILGDADLPLLFLRVPKGGYDQQIVWITGGSSGIGASLAKKFCEEGAKVIISARRVDKLREVAATCRGSSPPDVLQLDLTDTEAQKRAVSDVISRYGRIDVLVLNAGQSQRVPAMELSYDQLKQIVDLNFLTTVHLSQLVLPFMKQQNGGQIAVVSSLSGKFGTPIQAGYSASKFALHGYFDALRTEVQSMHNIHISLICPGPVESEIALKALRNPSLPKQSEGKKMETHRCAELILRGLYYKIPEMWISEQPFLALTYLGVYMPWINRQLMVRIIGPARVQMLKSGGNILDFKGLFNWSSKEKEL